MKTTLITLLLMISFCVLKAQKISNDSFTVVEATLSNEDKALGFNFIQFYSGVGLVAGFETGNYRFKELAKIEHDKYRIGLALNITDKTGEYILYSTYCYNQYEEIRDILDSIKEMETSTYEIGFRHMPKNSCVSFGFQYDVINKSGGFALGFTINKNK